VPFRERKASGYRIPQWATPYIANL